MAAVPSETLFLPEFTDEDAGEICESALRLCNEQCRLLELRNGDSKPFLSFPVKKYSKGFGGKKPDIQNSVPFRVTDNDNINYLKVADDFEKTDESEDEYLSAEFNIKQEPQSLSESLALKCQESPEITAETLHYACDVIDELEGMYEVRNKIKIFLFKKSIM